MRTLTLAVLAMVITPTLLSAQGRGMRGMGGRRGGPGGRGANGDARATPKFPVAKDLEKFNPAALLIDKRKKLSLSDSLVASLKALELKIYERNGALLAQYDSVRREYHAPSGSSGNDSEQTASVAQMRLMENLLEQLVERRHADVEESLGVIPDAEKKRAAEFLDKQDKDYLEQIPNGAGPRGDGRRGRPGSP